MDEAREIPMGASQCLGRDSIEPTGLPGVGMTESQASRIGAWLTVRVVDPGSDTDPNRASLSLDS
jgi:hypothetical protein